MLALYDMLHIRWLKRQTSFNPNGQKNTHLLLKAANLACILHSLSVRCGPQYQREEGYRKAPTNMRETDEQRVRLDVNRIKAELQVCECHLPLHGHVPEVPGKQKLLDAAREGQAYCRQTVNYLVSARVSYFESEIPLVQ